MPNLPSPHPPLSDAMSIELMRLVQQRGGNRTLKSGRKRELVRSLASLCARSYVDFLRLTGGRRLDDPFGAAKILADGSGAVGAIWHHSLIGMLMAYRTLVRSVQITGRYQAVVSESDDGEIIARIFRDCGGSLVRGSSNRRSMGAVVGAVAELKRGANLFLTPDGPRGPRREPKGGVLAMARMSGRPIIPCAASFGRALVFRGSWDEFELPLPFGRFCFHLGEPLFVPENATGEREEAYRQKLLARMAEVCARAERMPGRYIGVGKRRDRKSPAAKAKPLADAVLSI